MPHHPDSAPAFALFDDNLDASTAGAWLLTGLVEEIRCTDPDAWPAALARLEQAAKDGAWVALEADTLCVHGDSPGALRILESLRRVFPRPPAARQS